MEKVLINNEAFEETLKKLRMENDKILQVYETLKFISEDLDVEWIGKSCEVFKVLNYEAQYSVRKNYESLQEIINNLNNTVREFKSIDSFISTKIDFSLR